MKWTAFADLCTFSKSILFHWYPIMKSVYFIDTLHPIIIPFDRKLSDESTSFIQKQKLHFFLEESIIFVMRPYNFSITKHFHQNASAIIPKQIFSTNIKPVYYPPGFFQNKNYQQKSLHKVRLSPRVFTNLRWFPVYLQNGPLSKVLSFARDGSLLSCLPRKKIFGELHPPFQIL